MQVQDLSICGRFIDELAKRLDITEEQYTNAEKQYNKIGYYLETTLKESVNIHTGGFHARDCY